MATPPAGEIAWADRPEADPRIRYQVWSPKPGKDVIGILLSDVIRGVYLHYIDRRDRPCLMNVQQCEGCKLRIDRRWCGFVGAWDWKNGRLGIMKLTREAYNRCPQFELYRGALRGKILRLARSGEAKNSRVTATISLYSGAVGTVPPAFNLDTALEAMWFAPRRGESDPEPEGQPEPPSVPPGGNQPSLFGMGGGPYG